MGTVWKHPFGVFADIRKPDRVAPDTAVASAQSAALTRNTPQLVSERQALLEKLIARRPRSDGGVLQIEPADSIDSPAMYVVARQVLLRRRAGDTGTSWQANARDIIERFGYSVDDATNALLGAVNDRLAVFTSGSSVDATHRQGDIAASLTAGGLTAHATAGLMGVTVLQGDNGAAASAGSPRDVVVKSPGGPAPTEVQVPAHLQTAPATGAVIVAVIDTGITADLRPADKVLDEVVRTDDRLDPLDAFGGGTAAASANGRLDFAAGHGTFVAGIVRQVDPAAEIRVYRAVDSDGFGSEADVAAAMVTAVRQGAKVINLSLGTHTEPDENLAAIDAVLEWMEAIPEADRPVVVAAAGNAGTKRRVWPAASTRVIAVAGLTPTDPAPWSSHGERVDFSTVGRGVVSTFVEGLEDSAFLPIDEPADFYRQSPWAMWTGSSFAAPQIAGAISRAMRGEDKSPATPRTALEAVAWLKKQGDPKADYGITMELLPGA
jgi:hypothetical protein